MKILQKIEEAFDKAKRSRDKTMLNVIRSFKTEMTNMEKSKKSVSKNPVIDCLKKQLKQREASLIQYEKINRMDLANIERAESEIIKTFLPEQLDEDQIDELVQSCIFEEGATSIRDMGKVMALAVRKSEGRVDNGVLSLKVKQKLS